MVFRLSIALICTALTLISTACGAPIPAQNVDPISQTAQVEPVSASVITGAAECSKCASAIPCASGLKCYQEQCIKTEKLEEESIRKCFPNLAECAMCTEHEQCGSGKCSHSHCVSSQATEKSLEKCGVDIGSSHELPVHGEAHGYETGNVVYGYNSFGHHGSNAHDWYTPRNNYYGGGHYFRTHHFY